MSSNPSTPVSGVSTVKAPISRNDSSDGKKSGSEDQTAVRLRRAWRSLASSLVVAARAAEKVAKNGGIEASAADKDKKAMDDALEQVLRARADLSRVAAVCEAKLRGNAKETEALECSMRSQPSIGIKRKRDESSAAKEYI